MVTALVSQVDPVAGLQQFWSNVYLRGTMLYDPTGTVGSSLYQQPPGGVPFSRSWVIGPDQRVVLPQFGYDPQKIIDTIDGLLPAPGDATGDGVVNVDDLVAVIAAWGACPAMPCPADTNGDGTVDVDDLVAVIEGWS